MSIGFSSAARNLFLLGSSGEQVVTNFFKTIDQSAGTDGAYIPDEIRYNFVDQKFVLAGSAHDSNTKGFGWFEKRDQAGSAEWDVRVEAGAGINTTLLAMELDSNDNLIVVGKTADIPWIAKYSNGGVIDWQSTTNSGDVEYTGVTSDSNGQYYACGNTPTSGEAQAFVEKFDSNGNPGWGKAATMLGRDVVLSKIAANDRGEVVAVGYIEDDTGNKGYIVKIDTNTGEVLWDRTLQNRIELPSFPGYFVKSSPCNDVYIDSKDQIYIIGSFSDGFNNYGSYLIKYSPEGNIIWQRETPSNGDLLHHQQVKSDGETEQTIVLSRYFSNDNTNGDGALLLSKYSKDGSLVWRRTLRVNGGWMNFKVNLDADPSFYYVLFADDFTDELSGTPDRYTYGKVSSSGNGLGAFEYTDGGYGLTFDYLPNPITDKIGRLSDGSVRQDTSDLITYPFNANKLLFDDLATQVSNKKRQMDDADSFEYSGSPAIRPADFQELNLLGDVYSGSGDWLDQSGKGNDGIIPLSGPFAGSGSLNFPGGSTDRLEIANSADFNFGTGAYTIEMFIKTTAAAGWLYHENDPNNSGMRLCVGTNGSTGSNDGRIEFNEQVSNGDNVIPGSTQINDGQWHHIAVVRGASGDTTKLYVDGVLDATGSANRNFDSSDTLYIGARGTYGGNEYAGEISNLRVVKGVQVYTGNFTPPSAPLADVSGTSLLIDGSSITDTSSNNRTITVVGGITAKNLSPTHNAAGYWEFDGVDDRISFPDDTYTSGDITIEGWSWNDTLTAENNIFNIEDSTKGVVLLSSGSSGGYGVRFLVRNGTFSGSTNQSNIEAGTGVTNEWHHYVGTWNSSTGEAKAYIDGVLVGTDTNPASVGLDLSGGLPYGAEIGPSAGRGRWHDGRIGEVRIYPRVLTAAQVFQNYNATREKYTGVPASTDPGLTSTRTPA